MKKLLLVVLIIALSSCSKEDKKAMGEPDVMDLPGLSEETKKDVIVNKSFKNDDTFMIECKGYPREGLEGVARTESAKEAALINAQFCSRDLFDESVDVVRNGIIESYKNEGDYVVIRYVITKNRLRKFYKE